MSLAGRPSEQDPNGNSLQGVPRDLIWNEDDPPVIYPCSQDIKHLPNCSGEEDGIQLDSELQVRILNEGRTWARAGMSFQGIPAAYSGVIPKPGIGVELVDLLCWLEVIKEQIVELTGMSEFEFEEKFRERKLEFLQTIRDANEANIRRNRIRASLGVKNKPPLLGPGGEPLL